MYQILKKENNERRLEEELKIQIIGLDYIALKGKEGLVPLTKLSPFVIEKCW